MLNKVLGWVAKIAVGKQLLQGVNWVNGKASGHRSEVIIGLQVVLWALGHFGIVTGDSAKAADALAAALLGALPVTLAEKVKKATEAADRFIPEPTPTPPANG